MTLDNLTTFTAGTKAKASEINTNFSLVEDAVNENSTRIDTLNTSKAELISLPTEGNILTTNASGQPIDSAKSFDDTTETTNNIWSASKVGSELTTISTNLTAKTVFIPQCYWSKITNNSTLLTQDIAFNPGSQPDSTLSEVMTNTKMIKRLFNAWVPSFDNFNATGGRAPAVALAPDTTYYCFIISKPDGTTDAGFDSSLTAVNLLNAATGFTKYRRVGSVKTNSSSEIIPFTQRGDDFIFTSYKTDVALRTSNLANVTLSAPLKTMALCSMIVRSVDADGSITTAYAKDSDGRYIGASESDRTGSSNDYISTPNYLFNDGSIGFAITDNALGGSAGLITLGYKELLDF